MKSFAGTLATLFLLTLASVSPAQTPTIETGTLAHAAYRIDIPGIWNHSLIVFYHGYAESPAHFSRTGDPGDAGTFLTRGYAVLQSGFSVVGWALPQAYAETEQLRQLFIKEHGQPRETFVTGYSMGGALTMMTLEKNPGAYNGALDLCGAVVPTNEWAQRRFALRAAFDFYFPGLLPPMLPGAFTETEATHQALLAALAARPADAEKMHRLTGLYTDEHVAHLMQYIAYQVADFDAKSGGNAVDTANWIYTGTGSPEEDFRLNDGVRRYTADPGARRWMIENYTATGRVLKPMLAVHTVYDNLIPATSLAAYAERVAESGNSDRFVQQFVDHIGHCNISRDEVGRAFDELVLWSHGGARPVAGKLP